MKNAFVLVLVACMLVFSASTFAVVAAPTNTLSVVASVLPPAPPPPPPIPPNPGPPPHQPPPVVCHVLPMICGL